ncbi:MAG: PLP-dependent threonine dehydratase [Gammaproteobacteria bacterium RIFOXYD12_FULL_61_37]|nr:MAG: PLP-dependent threonine dehydratase [Gammaproteobacteria bacterium RIFOXYD12_FULL_61_37]
MPSHYIERILRARVYDVAKETPLNLAKQLSERTGNTVYLKREDLQPVFSFKLRGAYNRITQIPVEARERGVITASAGNHAQGVALSAHLLGIKATIVMPKTTPPIKVRSVRRLGGKPVLHGDSYDDAYQHALTLAGEHGQTFIHPFDDPEVIAGQGTIAAEILRQHPAPIDAIFVPIGGGGLIGGVAAYVKYVRPETKIVGVEPEDAACMHAALAAGKRVSLQQVGLFADGVAVRQVGVETFKLAKLYVDEVILVSTDEICAAIKDIFEDTRTIAEPAGALSVAGLKKYVQRESCSGKSLVAIESGANINFDRLRHVAERAELGEQREALLAVEIPERPGSFHQFCKLLGRRSITEFNYRYADSRNAQVFAGIEIAGDEERKDLIARLNEHGYPVTDMTDNEVAKLHIRYMVGGHAPGLKNELLYRFEFPERPGSLFDFLTRLGRSWNISLFHYRNHGSAYGRVLMGIQVSGQDKEKLQGLLEKMGYPFAEETANPAYQLFAGTDQITAG